MEYQYRGHTFTLNDKVVECFTSCIEPTLTDSLFDMYLIDIYGDEDTADINDIDLTQYSDEELSAKVNSSMLDECQVLFKIRGQGYWDDELKKIEEEEKMMGDTGLEEGDD